MRKVLVVVGVFVLGAAVGGFVQESMGTLFAQGGGSGPRFAVQNGDVNGDGNRDIADAVYLLTWKFVGGLPDPVPVQFGPRATGQTRCYGNTSTEVDCRSAEFPGQDGSYQMGSPWDGCFIDNGDDTVTDECTGLMWQKHALDTSGNGSSGREDFIDWPAALKFCEASSIAGYCNWRLPNVRELLSIVDYGRSSSAFDPAFDVLYNDPEKDFYWSATSYARDPSKAWNVRLVDGHATGSDSDQKSVRFGVLAVRSANESGKCPR